jgi:general secretion pathway protein F
MPEFSYIAVSPAGVLQRGVMQAPDAATVIETLQRQGSTPTRAEPTARGSGWLRRVAAGINGGGRISAQELAEFTRELATLLPAGQSLDRALHFMAETGPSRRLRTLAEALVVRLREGGALSVALASQRENFPPLYIGMVKAGEAGGTLGPTLGHLAELLEQQRNLTATLQSAMVYPLCVLAAAGGSIVLLLTRVLPEFEPLFAQSGAALPKPTQWLIASGNFVSNDGPMLGLLLIFLSIAANLALRLAPVRLATDRLVLRLPLFGGLVREREAARMTRTLGTLLTNGVALIPALAITRDVLANQAALRALDEATAAARDGEGLAVPLARGGVFPARTMHLLRLGEETARLGPMALHAAVIHEARLRHQVQRMVALLGPAITIGLGATVAAIFAALMLAMLSLNDLAG